MDQEDIHRRANFPRKLEISYQQRKDREDLCSEQEHFSQDLELFGIAAKTWDASFDLLDYLLVPNNLREYQPASPLLPSTRSHSENKIHIIDLGSGTCYLPIGLATRLDPEQAESIKITVTDLPAVLPLLERNIQTATEKLEISARTLSWGDTDQTIDLLKSTTSNQPTDLLITCSDLVFFPFLFAPLIRTLLILTSPHYLPSNYSSTPVILFGYKERSAVKEFPFFSLLGRYFKLEPIISRSDPTGPWELLRNHRDKEDEDDGSKVYLIRATRHPSTIDLDLQSTILNNNHDGNGDHDHPEQLLDPLFLHGDGSATDQWEWILLSNLTDQSIF
ncbi:hypothetical protein PGTUg99_033518 [Puccinia graminis f. sp. tritici]|uniref:Uncharacterized protein n=1 Tax=Puccinia graminis f. sp. tritici TaxID=56615 RepID=A0A5B0S7W7_PUCGR|nr:hypothetical protein PGTUg99_033518 [Puccinia graminis f. sp. tritici]